MLDRALVFLDLETTGAAAHFDRITEIGLVEVDNGRHLGEWSTLVNPERPISSMIESLTGITDAMVANAPTFAELADDCSNGWQARRSLPTTPASISDSCAASSAGRPEVCAGRALHRAAVARPVPAREAA